MFYYQPGQGAVKLQNIIAVLPDVDVPTESVVYLTDGSKLVMEMTVEGVLQMIEQVLRVGTIVAEPKTSVIVPDNKIITSSLIT